MRRWLSRLGWVVLALGLLPYWLPPIYERAPVTPFTGPWHNPYQGVAGPYAQVALHVHGEAWGGLTSGRQPTSELISAYRDAGYQAVVVSDYMKLTPEGSAVPAYEHGYNITKTHQTVLGAKHVVWLDQPIQTFNGKQLMLRWLSRSAPLVVLSHPLLHQGYSLDELTALDGYQAMEVATHSDVWPEAWDAALTAGRRVWGVGGDDTHDLESRHETWRAWTMVASQPPEGAVLLEALLAGRSYAVWSSAQRIAHHNGLKALTVDGDTLRLELLEPADELRLIRQGGEVAAVAKNAGALEYQLKPTDRYLRAEAVVGPLRLFFNPVSRAGATAPNQIAWGWSLAAWLGPLLGALAVRRWRSNPLR